MLAPSATTSLTHPARTYPSVALESDHWPHLREEPNHQLSTKGTKSPGLEGSGDTCLVGFTWRGGAEGGWNLPSPFSSLPLQKEAEVRLVEMGRRGRGPAAPVAADTLAVPAAPPR